MSRMLARPARRLGVVVAAVVATVSAGLVVAPSGSASTSRPTITSVPASVNGDCCSIASVHGTGFGDDPHFYVGGTRAGIYRWGATYATLKFPPHPPGDYHVRVVTSAGESPATAHDVVHYTAAHQSPWRAGDPYILKIEPVPHTSAQVYVRGLSLSHVNAVLFDGHHGSDLHVVSSTAVRVTVPSGVSGAVQVAAYVDALRSPYATMRARTFVSRPEVGEVPLTTPSSGAAVTIHGENLIGVSAAYVGSTRVPLANTQSFVAHLQLPPHAAGPVHVRLATPYAESSAVDSDVTYYTAKQTQHWTAAGSFDPHQGTSVDMSCPTADFCALIDDHDVAFYDGTSWSTSELVSTGTLTSISCVDSTFCVAGGAGGTLWTYRGDAWTGDPVAPNGIADVSCPTTTDCTALGTHGGITRYNGRSWTQPQNEGLLSGAALSCPTTTFCVATGSTFGSMELANGHWTDLDDSNVFRNLRSVSCVSATFCEASDHGGLAYGLVGRTWTVQSRGPGIDAAISCSSPTYCIATDFVADVTRWDGHAWTAQVGAVPWPNGLLTVSCSPTQCLAGDAEGKVFPDERTSFGTPVQVLQPAGDGVAMSCPATTFCVNVDESGGVWTWDGTHWSARTEVAPGPYATGWVTCPTTRFCVLSRNGLVSTWNGSSWTDPQQIAGLPAFDEVSCTSPSFCMAMTHDDATSAVWNGDAWRAEPTPANSGLVSCGTPTFCLSDSARWDGTHWIHLSNPPDFVTALSCAGPDFCLASGSDGDVAGTVFWRDGSWRDLHAYATADAVSCTSATWCVAVSGVGGTRSWNGSTWSDRTVLPARADDAAVSCAAPNRCMTVIGGSYFRSSPN